ncbi:hypothetical protein B0H14DRAFT_203309 [Mycena olivaceomarginata]|nr:hypothetical protein B0H14DRAFT_203309 [Mycena olivaceomarginata]
MTTAPWAMPLFAYLHSYSSCGVLAASLWALNSDYRRSERPGQRQVQNPRAADPFKNANPSVNLKPNPRFCSAALRLEVCASYDAAPTSRRYRVQSSLAAKAC